MAGPNPYRLYSFAELRAVMGRSWLVCEHCRRFAPLAGDLRGRDTRTTTFSCSVCGGQARHVFDDPAKTGKLQFDPRRRPRHHADAKVRLRAAKVLRDLQAERGHKIPREDLLKPAWKSQSPEPRRVYTLRPFPVRTFGDIASWGLRATVDCRACHRTVPLDVGGSLGAQPIGRARLTCTGLRPATALSEAQVCGTRGGLYLSPADFDGVPSDGFLSVECYNFDHTSIDVSYLPIEQPPWKGLLGKDENFSCPICGHRMRHHWHGADRRGR